MRVGVMADPGLPEKVARSLADGLARTLSASAGTAAATSTSWEVEVSRETLPLNADGDIPLLERAHELRREHGWDCMVYLTDLPRSHEGEPLLCEVSTSAGAALVSLPAMGLDHFATKMRKLMVTLVRSMQEGSAEHPPESAVRHALGHGRVRRVPPAGPGDASRVVLPGRLNRWRLLAGMVHSNRPGRLLPALSSCVAAAAATGAFGIFYAAIWNMSDALSAVRLAGISAVVTAALSAWLIVHNRLWSRPADAAEPWRVRADNTATVITVWLSVALMYVVLWCGLFLVGLAVIEAGYLQSQLGHPVSLLDYGHLSWLAASLGTLAGALGSNFDSDDAIREATYSRREHQRRLLADTYDD